ncbi:hypothetical protein DPEC_G00171880 [Dallia pectoralis]|uniref:Uncharacterized protein n=1 Tax=Dallia pectoralis TaxID=75939 RepID=A0ACC2GDQ9_DALPE|nr:hypothetical protein DPEC_G00171880 [Dallia pectoralis]
MCVWVLLLLATLVTGRLRCARAEGGPLPPSLVELVKNSPISSIEELQRLLEQDADSIEEEPINLLSSEIYSNETHRRLKRNLDAQPAQQAVCKVRTEVMEITRAMLDRRNANFLLWPPCVEVQRCSGCCNHRQLQCVPVVVQTRFIQVTRIQYIDKKAHYDTAVIPVEDHVSCHSQRYPAPAPLPRSTPSPPPVRLTPRPPSLYKQDLHRHDDMKANQRLSLDDREQQERQWQAMYTQPRTHTLAEAAARTHTPVETHTQAHTVAQRGPLSDAPLGHGSGKETEVMTQYIHDSPQSDSSGPPDPKQLANYRPEQDYGNTEPANEKDSVPDVANGDTQKDTEFTNQRHVEKEMTGHRDESDKEWQSGKALTNQEQRHSESTNQEHRGSELTNQGNSVAEEERRKKLLELLQKEPEQKQQPQLPRPHLPHQQTGSLRRPSQTWTDATVQRPVPPTLSASRASGRPSSTPSRPPERPFRPAVPRGRGRKKNRRRISKASLRAMIM